MAHAQTLVIGLDIDTLSCVLIEGAILILSQVSAPGNSTVYPGPVPNLPLAAVSVGTVFFVVVLSCVK